MGEWDMEQLEKAIAEKHGLENKNRPTAIVCRYFLDAVEKKQYGWCVEMASPFTDGRAAGLPSASVWGD